MMSGCGEYNPRPVAGGAHMTDTIERDAAPGAAAEAKSEPKIGSKDKLEELCVNTIRFLAIDAVEKANSGHPGTPMGLADIAYVIWTEFLHHDPLEPKWENRDQIGT